jgi:short-subunit dehydrogenase
MMLRRGVATGFTWTGTHVLITGGSSGIGKRIAIDLLRLGASVGIVSEDIEKLRAAAVDLKQISSEVWCHSCDVAMIENVRAMAIAYRRDVGVPDVLINNAGYALYYTFDQTSPEEIHRLFDVNLVGAALVTREFLPDMIRAGGGHIVMMASIAGRIPMTPCGVYSSSKHGLVAFSELLQIETAGFNINVHVICPGRVETDFFAHESFRARRHRPEASRTIPVGTVSHAVLNAIKRNKFMTYVPRYYALLAWCAAAAPGLFKPLWHRLMRSRVESARARVDRSERA